MTLLQIQRIRLELLKRVRDANINQRRAAKAPKDSHSEAVLTTVWLRRSYSQATALSAERSSDDMYVLALTTWATSHSTLQRSASTPSCCLHLVYIDSPANTWLSVLGYDRSAIRCLYPRISRNLRSLWFISLDSATRGQTKACVDYTTSTTTYSELQTIFSRKSARLPCPPTSAIMPS